MFVPFACLNMLPEANFAHSCMADMDPQIYLPVVDGDADVALTMDGEQMKVQAPGRLPMQRVYLWVGNRDQSKKKEIGS